MIVPKEILTQHVAILGKTRSGKSSVMRGLVEHLIEEHRPVCIVDPKGDWWGLKLARDGKHEGFPVVIFGGEHADIPIDEERGAEVAELVATWNRPCLIDLGGWMPGPRTRFWIAFASTLFKNTKGERWLAIDEVHNFCPKGKIMDPDSGKALHWTNRLASEGLGKGLQMIFASQRPQKVHNDTLTSAETLIAMRVLHPSDRGAVSDWIKGCGDSEGSEVLSSLAQMARGEGWVWSPEVGFGPKRVKFPMFKTYDSFRPQTVDETSRLTGWAEIDLDDVRERFKASIERAKADDPKILKQRIIALELERKILQGGDTAAMDALVHKFKTREGELLEVNQELRSELIQNQNLLAAIQQLVSQSKRTDPPAATSPIEWREPQEINWGNREITHGIRHSKPSDGLSTAERRILTVLAQRKGGVEIDSLAVLAGYTVNGHFTNTLGGLRTMEFISPARVTPIQITSAGLSTLGAFEPLPTGRSLQNWWLGKLNKAEAMIMSCLWKRYPRAIELEDLARECGYTVNGHFTNTIGQLRTKGLMTPARTPIKSSDDFF